MSGESNGEQQLCSPSRVVALQLTRNGEGLSLSLRLQDSKGLERTFNFSGVTELRFRGEKTELLSLVLLFVENVSARGWEGIRFRVGDYEEEFISFFCRAFEEESRA